MNHNIYSPFTMEGRKGIENLFIGAGTLFENFEKMLCFKSLPLLLLWVTLVEGIPGFVAPVQKKSKATTPSPLLKTTTSVNGSINSEAQAIQLDRNDNCPSIFGENFPTRQQQMLKPDAQGRQVLCQWVIISDRRNCPQFFQHCGPNPPMCQRQNEIWFQCISDCEPSCGNPAPSCRRRCPHSGCQCFPGFLRNQDGLCVATNQCPDDGGQDGCTDDSDCPGSSNICQDDQCQQGCTAGSQCEPFEQCSQGRCVERKQCRADGQCKLPKICVFGVCRRIETLNCRSHFDCPGSAFCGNSGRCRFPFRSFDSIEFDL